MCATQACIRVGVLKISKLNWVITATIDGLLARIPTEEEREEWPQVGGKVHICLPSFLLHKISFFALEDKSDFYFKWLKTWSHSSSLNVQWTFVIQSTTSLIKEWHCYLQKRIKSTTKYFLTLSLTFEFWVLCVRLEYSGRHTRDRLWVFLSQVVLWFRFFHLYWYCITNKNISLANSF